MTSRVELKAEIVKCGQDPVYFINKYMKVQHPKRGTIPFKTYDFQNDVITAMREHRFNIVLKSRQLGLSTITAAYAVWLSIFYKDQNILIIATKKDVAVNLIKKIKFMLKSIPEWLVMPKYEETQTSIRYTNGSEIKAVPTSPDAGRSEALSLLIVDEAAIIRDFDEIWTGLAPTLSTGGSAILLSTPYGVGGMYYKIWTDAEAGQNNFNTIRLPWHVHPEHDQQWFDQETASLSKRQISQEFICDFTSSGDTFLQPENLDIIRDMIRTPTEKLGFDRNIWLWSRPRQECRYVITADVARGDAADYSAFHIIDCDTSEVVGEYMGKIPPEKLADLLIEYGKLFNTALLCPENNSFGYAVASKLRDLKYQRLFYASCKGDPFNYTPKNSEELPGFSTQKGSRVQIMGKLEELLRNQQLKTRSQRTYDQLRAFVWNGSKPQASKDSNDDLVVSLAIAAWIVGGSHNESSSDYEMALAIQNATKVSSRTTESFQILNEVQPLVNPYLRVHNPNSGRPHRTTRGINDFSWLLK